MGASLAILTGLAACAPTYTPPEQAVALKVTGKGDVIKTETVIVTARLVSGAAIAEINQASCVAQFSGRKVDFKTPLKFDVPIRAGAQPDIVFTCATIIGPSKLVQRATMIPNVLDITAAQASKQRVYPQKFIVNFPQVDASVLLE